MALSVCTSCTTKYAVGLPKCPHCGSTDHVEDGQPMPKITVHGGASDKTLAAEPDPEAVDAPESEPAPADEAVDETPQQADEEPSSTSEESAQEPEPNYEDSTVEELKDLLAERGLPKTGKRDGLLARLREDDATRTAGAE